VITQHLKALEVKVAQNIPYLLSALEKANKKEDASFQVICDK
jgi:hypothetical protein